MVTLQAGGTTYQVPTGRRDGRVSRAADVNLPGPTMSVSEATSAFRAKGMSQNDLVTLLGNYATNPIIHLLYYWFEITDIYLRKLEYMDI